MSSTNIKQNGVGIWRGAAFGARGVVLLLIATGWGWGAAPQQVNSSSEQNRGSSEGSRKAALPDTPKPQEEPSLHPRMPVPPRRLSVEERFGIYVHSITNVSSVADPAFDALINQAKNDPAEWGQGAAGYGRRFGSGYGRMLITRTLRFGIAAADHEDPLFHPSNETTFVRRLRYATVHYVLVETDGGTPIPAFSRFGGIYGAAFISNAWYPSSHATTGHALLRGTTALGAGIGWNVFREFWPDIKNAAHRNK